MRITKFVDFLLLLLIFSIPFENWAPFGVETTASVARITGIIYFLFVLFFSPRFLQFNNFKAIFIIIVVFYFFYSISTLFNYQYIDGLNSVFSPGIFQNIIMFMIVSNHIIMRPQMMNSIFITLLLSISFLGVLSLFDVGKEIAGKNELSRITMFGENPNSFGNKAVIGLIISLHYLLLKKFKSIFYQIFLIVLLPLFFYMVFISASRGALIAFFIVMFFSFYYLKTKRIYKVGLIFLGISISVFLFDTYILNKDNLISTRVALTITERDVGGREFLIKQAIDGIQNNPIIGVSRIPLSDENGKFRDPHNVFLAVFLSSGLLGFLPFLYLIVQIAIYTVQIYKGTGYFIFIVFFILIMFIMFKQGGFINSKLLWLTLAIINGSYIIFRRNNHYLF